MDVEKDSASDESEKIIPAAQIHNMSTSIMSTYYVDMIVAFILLHLLFLSLAHGYEAS